MTPAEQALWQYLRDRRLEGLKFRRQHPLGPFITDFCCPEHRLIIEVDGWIHQYQQAYDQARTEVLQQYGYRVLRFSNAMVLEDMAAVLETIVRATETTPPSCLDSERRKEKDD
jgi:very-short-patch-repair endonuclease